MAKYGERAIAHSKQSHGHHFKWWLNMASPTSSFSTATKDAKWHPNSQDSQKSLLLLSRWIHWIQGKMVKPNLVVSRSSIHLYRAQWFAKWLDEFHSISFSEWTMLPDFQPPWMTEQQGSTAAKTLRAAGTVSESCSAWASTTKRWHLMTTLLVATKAWLTFGADVSKPLRCAQVHGSAKKLCLKTCFSRSGPVEVSKTSS